MGIGEAAVTILSETGVPTPVVHTRLVAPQSRMGPADDVSGAARASPLWGRYGTRIDSQSAREILAARVEKPAPPPATVESSQPAAPAPEPQHEEAASAAGGRRRSTRRFS